MFDRIAPRYDLLNRILTFRLDVSWRRTAVHSLELVSGARVLDLACGTGDLCRTLAADRLPADRCRLLRRHARRRAHRRAAGAGPTRTRLPFPTSARRAHVRVRAPKLRRPRSGAFRVRAGSPAEGPHRADRRERTDERARACRARVVVPPRRAVRGRPALRPQRLCVPPGVHGLPARATCRSCEWSGAAGFVDVSHRSLGAGAAQLITGTRS